MQTFYNLTKKEYIMTDFHVKSILSNKEASQYLNCASNSLKQSRSTGTLFGVQAPAYIKLGFNIRYKLSTLDDWLNQFKEQLNTSQNVSSK